MDSLSFDHYLIAPNISGAGNIWINGPTQEGIITYSIITPIICMFGIVGNTISLIVLSRKELKGSVYVYLAAFVDLCSSILLFMSGLSCGLLYSNNWPIYDALVGLPLSSTFNTMCVLTTLMVTAERILYLANPLNVRKAKPKLCHSYVARRIMVVCFIISFIINAPYWFIFESDEKGELRTRSFYYSRSYNYYNWIRFLLLGVLPSVFLICGNGYLIYALAKIKKIYGKCNESVRCRRPQNYASLTTTLILIVFFFVISQVPSMLTNRANASTFFFSPKDSNDTCNSKFLENIRETNTVIYAINLSSDFVLYYLFCPPFCKVCAKLLRKRKDNKSVQMNVFVLDKQICFDKNIESIKELAAGKLFEMMDPKSNRDSLPSSVYDCCDRLENNDGVKSNRDTLVTVCSSDSINE